MLLLTLDCSTLPLIPTLYCWVLSKEVSSTIYKVFGMTQPEIEPRFPRLLANTLPTRPIIMGQTWRIKMEMCYWFYRSFIVGFNRNNHHVTLTEQNSLTLSCHPSRSHPPLQRGLLSCIFSCIRADISIYRPASTCTSICASPIKNIDIEFVIASLVVNGLRDGNHLGLELQFFLGVASCIFQDSVEYYCAVCT